MKEETKQALEIITHNPKTAWLTSLLAGASTWVLENVSPIIGFMTQLGGLVLVIVLIRLHWVNGSKANEERERIGKNNHNTK